MLLYYLCMLCVMSMFLCVLSICPHLIIYVSFLCLLVPPLFCCVLLPAGGGKKTIAFLLVCNIFRIFANVI